MALSRQSFLRKRHGSINRSYSPLRRNTSALENQNFMSNSFRSFRSQSFRRLQPTSMSAKFDISELDFSQNNPKPTNLPYFSKRSEKEIQLQEEEIIAITSKLDHDMEFKYFFEQKLEDKYEAETNDMSRLSFLLQHSNDLSEIIEQKLYNVLQKCVGHTFFPMPESLFLSDSDISFGVTDRNLIIAGYDNLNYMLTRYPNNVPNELYQKLIKAMGSPCKEEGYLAKDALICLFKIDKANRELIFAKVFNEIEKYKDNLIQYFFIDPALKFLTTIIKLLPQPIPSYYFATSRTVIFPLIRCKDLHVYYSSFAENCEIFYSKDSTTALFYIRYMIKHWPMTNSHKQILYLNQLHLILYKISSSFFPTIYQALCAKLFFSVRSINSSVAITALNIIGDEGFINMIISTAGFIPKIVSESINVAINSWNVEVRTKAEKIEEKLISLCSKYEESRFKGRPKWNMIIKAASANFRDVDFSKCVDELNKNKIDC